MLKGKSELHAEKVNSLGVWNFVKDDGRQKSGGNEGKNRKKGVTPTENISGPEKRRQKIRRTMG